MNRISCLRAVMAATVIGLGASTTRQVLPIQPAPLPIPASVQLPAVVPIRYWQGIPVVDCFINQKAFATFAIDSGLNAITISPAVYKSQSLQAVATRVRLSVFQTTTDAMQAKLASLHVGSVALSNLTPALIDVSSLVSASGAPQAPSGWLGTPFLSAFQVTVDYPEAALVLMSIKTKPPAASIAVPLFMRDGRPFVKIQVGKATVQALLDTGCPGTLIPVAVAAQLKLKPATVTAISGVGGRLAKVGFAVVPSISMGKAVVHKVMVGFLSVDAPAGFDKTSAVLGVNFLSHFKVTLNYASKHAFLEPVMSIAPPASVPSKPARKHK
ncbi:MAG: clan AA aspartic protease [Armatimonadetes bacterium]|nr:clan AA aspartic protease [Armatimonadota bacterium]MDE2206481.1 clan AA aspartic protease [Armatimonadota bacterium]